MLALNDSNELLTLKKGPDTGHLSLRVDPWFASNQPEATDMIKKWALTQMGQHDFTIVAESIRQINCFLHGLMTDVPPCDHAECRVEQSLASVLERVTPRMNSKPAVAITTSVEKPAE